MKTVFPESLVPCRPLRRRTLVSLVLSGLFLFICANQLRGQAAESADAGHGKLWAGGSFSAATLGYGDRRMLGATAFVDADTMRHLGIETEVRWLDFHQTANVHAETYLAGLRYHMNTNRYQLYGKALVGNGHFNFPYNFATGNYFVLAYGGGLDYTLSRRWKTRLDLEYQDWPQFTYGQMSSVSLSVGVRYRIF
jgi:opacity protein-like surface antigen